MKKIIALLYTLTLSFVINAQTVTDYFKTSPSVIFNSIDSVSRIKMCDMAKEGMSIDAVTIFGDSIITGRVTDKFMSFRYSGCDVQIKLIDDVIVVSNSYGDEVKNSEIQFFDKEWNLKSSWIYGVKESGMMPSDKNITEALVVKPDTISGEEFERLKLYLDPMFVKAELSDTEDAVILSAGCPLLSAEEKIKLLTILKQKTFKWINKKFK